MSTLSNSQGLMFAAISADEPKDVMSSSVGGWVGAQQFGQAKVMITDAVRAAKGVVTHTLGDAVLSSFPDARSALKAALDVQRRLAAQGAKRSLKLRAGLAFGPVRVMAGKVSGDAVSAASLLLDKAAPGEILIDQAMKDAIGKFDYVVLKPHAAVEGIQVYRAAEAGAASPDHSTTQSMPRPVLPPVAPTPTPPPPPPPPPKRVPAPDETVVVSRLPILVLRYGAEVRHFSAADGEVTLGRALENHVNVSAPHVSRKHAKIVWEANLPVLLNLSRNGTYVRFEGGAEKACDTRLELRGSGLIALANEFGVSPDGADVVRFSCGA